MQLSGLVLARTLASPCFGRKPKAKVATFKIKHVIITNYVQHHTNDHMPPIWKKKMITILIPPQFIFIRTLSNDSFLYTITSWYDNLMGPLIL
jgi:hypothetical protein